MSILQAMNVHYIFQSNRNLKIAAREIAVKRVIVYIVDKLL